MFRFAQFQGISISEQSAYSLARDINIFVIIQVMSFFSIKGSKEMLNLSVSYKTLLRITGLLLFLYGFFWVVRALFVQIDVSGDQQYIGPLIFWDSGQILAYIFYGLPLFGEPVLGGWFHGFVLPGPLLYVSVGLCLLALSTLRPWLVYWSLQIALWLVSMSFWAGLAVTFNQNGIDVPGIFTPFFWITLLCSLVLLAACILMLALLKKVTTQVLY